MGITGVVLPNDVCRGRAGSRKIYPMSVVRIAICACDIIAQDAGNCGRGCCWMGGK